MGIFLTKQYRQQWWQNHSFNGHGLYAKGPVMGMDCGDFPLCRVGGPGMNCRNYLQLKEQGRRPLHLTVPVWQKLRVNSAHIMPIR